jgi:hypothetical protein
MLLGALLSASPCIGAGPSSRGAAMDRRSVFAVAIVAALAALSLRAGAQEVGTILRQKYWSAAGVTVDNVNYAFCSVVNDSHADAHIWLQVSGGDDSHDVVRVMHPGDDGATAAVLDIGGEHFVLDRKSGDDFVAAETDGARIVRAMKRGTSLTLRFTGSSSPATYAYSLIGFTRVQAAIAKACHTR